MAVSPSAPAPASLYVGDLHPDITDGDLFQAFSEIGAIGSVRVCRDSITGRSLEYGYVNYISTQDATKAIEELNHTPLNGKVIRIMWSHRDPDARKSGIGNLFVKNLNESIDNVKLHEMFSKFGNILSCKVVVSPEGKSRGYGFVQFESEKSANTAIGNLNGTMVLDKQIYVGNFIKRSERILPSPDVKYTNLYMKNLDPDATEEVLQEKFSGFGKISNLVILKDCNENSRGFGFVNFENPNDAKQALEKMNGVQLGSKLLYVARAQKKAEREQILHCQFEERQNEQMQKYKGTNVYVKNIDDDVNDEDLRKHFSQCGTITSVKLMHDERGISRGFGFVCFSTPEEANKAVSTLHGYMFHRKPLYVAIAQRKEDRTAQLQMQYAQCMAAFAGPNTAVIPTGYPPLYYNAHPPGVVSKLPPRQGLTYQPLGQRPGWRANAFPTPARPAFQPMPLSVIPNTPMRQNRQNSCRMNGNVISQGGQSVSFMPHMQQTAQSLKDASGNQQQRGIQAKYVANGRSRDLNNGSSSTTATPGLAASHGSSEILSGILAATSPGHQKRILGERLFPLVKKLKLELAAKITGMLLEMDNSELLLLLESPESLAAKVDEAVQVLELSKAKVSSGTGGQDVLHTNYLSSEVAVN